MEHTSLGRRVRACEARGVRTTTWAAALLALCAGCASRAQPRSLVVDEAGADAADAGFDGGRDSGAEAEAGNPPECTPNFHPIPAATEYTCEAGAPGAGCLGPPGLGGVSGEDLDASFPLGCRAFVPLRATYCAGPAPECCGAVACDCLQGNSVCADPDSGYTCWVCQR